MFISFNSNRYNANPTGDGLTFSTAIEKENVFSEGILQGYQTLDALGAICLSAVLIKSLVQKGYKREKDRVNILLKAGFIAALGLALVYGGLTYLGATVSTQYGVDVSQSALIVAITVALLGTPGKVVLSLIVTLACLTTAIGLTSATAEYFSGLTKNKLKYSNSCMLIKFSNINFRSGSYNKNISTNT